ncbi:MAG: hypothetical protein HND51_12565 [Chloroflexi bacterium]|nr:hypothetical protein [Chloroflexota bacterium]
MAHEHDLVVRRTKKSAGPRRAVENMGHWIERGLRSFSLGEQAVHWRSSSMTAAR